MWLIPLLWLDWVKGQVDAPNYQCSRVSRKAGLWMLEAAWKQKRWCAEFIYNAITAGVKYLPAKISDFAFIQQNQEACTPDEPSSCKPRDVKTNRADEVDSSSVMAWLGILKGWIDILNSTNLGEHPVLLDSVDVEGCLGRKDALCSFPFLSCENTAMQKSENYTLTRVAGLSFLQKNSVSEDEPSKHIKACWLQLHAEEQHIWKWNQQKKSVPSKTKKVQYRSSSNIQLLDTNANDEIELYPNNNSESRVSESPVKGKR